MPAGPRSAHATRWSRGSFSNVRIQELAVAMIVMRVARRYQHLNDDGGPTCVDPTSSPPLAHGIQLIRVFFLSLPSFSHSLILHTTTTQA